MTTTIARHLARTHIALAVGDLEASIDFYRRLLGVEPVKVRDDYAKFEPDVPALALALNAPARSQRDGLAAATPQHARPAAAASLDDDCLCCRAGPVTHLGIVLPDQLALDAARTRLEASGLPLRLEADVTCCYARQDKLWAVDPDGNPWEVYVLLEDVDTPTRAPVGAEASACCADVPGDAGSCC